MRHQTHTFQLLHTKFLCLFLLFLSFNGLQAQNWQEVLDGEASDGDTNDNFGYAVSISGDYAIIGARSESHDVVGANSLSSAGSAYIFERSGGTWSQVQKIVASDRGASDRFGYSVAISGNYALVGAYQDDEDAAGANTLSNAGSAYIFERSGGTWTQVQKIVASDRGDSDNFGNSVAISGDYAIIGAYREDEDDAGANTLSSAGAAYIFERSGATWSEVEKVVASDRGASDEFGKSVSISGDYALIGADRETEDVAGANTFSDAGSAYIFERSGGTWSQVQKLVASDRAASDRFGESVSISGDYAIMGAYQEDEDAAGANNASNAGSAYIFERSGGTWSEVQKIVASDRAANDEFGNAVAIAGDYVLIGAYKEDEDADGANNASNAGSAYIFERSGGAWSEMQKVVASDRSSSDNFGFSVAISASQLLVGAYNGNSSEGEGKSYFFHGPWTFPHGGYALAFDGTNDFVDCGYVTFGSTMTIESWVKTTDNKPASEVVSWGRSTPGSGAVEFSVSLGKLLFGMNDGTFSTVTSNTSINDGNWHHIAAVKDGSAISLYIDGLLDQTGTVSQTVSVDKTFLGVLSVNAVLQSASYFGGSLDEVRIWSDVRTQAEIQANMNKELTGEEADLAAYYLMYDSTGTSLTDNSGNSHVGTIATGPSWETSGALAGPDMALDFDGGNDYVWGSLNATASASLTVEGWFSFNSLTNQQNLLRIHQTGNSFTRIVPFKTAANIISFYIFDGTSTYTVNSTFSISQINTWNHLAFVYDAGTVTIYANGNQVGNASSQGSFSTAATNNISIGADSDGASTSLYSNAKIDEVRIWGDARTEAEIRANKDHILRGDEEDLIAYYRFDQQAHTGNTMLYDLTSNGNNGTLTNMDGATDWVSSNAFNTWVGNEDSDWNNAENWSRRSVPSTEDVGVYGWSGNNLPASANISARNFYLDNGLTINHSGNLTLTGDYYNGGTFTTTGNVSFSGGVSQTIRGTGTSTFGTFTVNNSAGVVMNKDISTTSSLALTDGLLNLNGNTLTLGSSASVSGTPSHSIHVIATSGILQKDYSGTGNFSFPVGDGSLYSPISLNFTAGTFSSGNASVSLSTSKHPNNASSVDYLRRFWTVNSSGISSFSCDVTASYDNSDINGTEGDMVSGKWDGSSWTNLGAVTDGSNLISGTVSSFSDFTAGEPTAFPVEWLDFQAKFTQKEEVQLDWITASELNADFFAIERSQIQGQWIELGTVRAAGNSTETTEYRYIDPQPLRGKTYYRLRQVDIDGAFDYSTTVEINWEDHPILIYPNPVSDILTLELPKKSKSKLRILDINGRVIIKTKLSGGKQSLQMGSLSPGRYLLLFKDEKGRRQEFQVVKE